MRLRRSRTAVLAAGIAAVLASVSVTSAASRSPAGSTPSTALPSTASSVTQGLLISAAKTEAEAFMQYATYADAAVRHPSTARVWRAVGEVEHQDHWTHEITLSNYYSGSDNIGNLKIAIAQAQQAAGADSNLAAKAPRRSVVAAQLAAVARRQGANARLLTRTLAGLQIPGHGMPAVPAVTTVPIRVSPKPRYSGTFYDALTGPFDSALERAAWNWAEYQFMAKVAVSTGQARVAAIFAALEAQERYQNWAVLSNAAGYANGIVTNLKTSIASEQGAIDMYGQYAPQAQTAGDSSVASAFLSIQGDEMGHKQTFTTELNQLRHGG